MLILTRKAEQKICIGNSITITVLRVRGNTVRLGIEAPDGVRVLRAELQPLDEVAAQTPPRPVEEPHKASSQERGSGMVTGNVSATTNARCGTPLGAFLTRRNVPALAVAH
jgi:carbon storage regulator CsrA